MTAAKPTRPEISAAVTPLGWRYTFISVQGVIRVASTAEAAGVAAQVAEACGPDADDHLTFDLRPDRVLITVRSQEAGDVTWRDIDIVRLISGQGLTVGPGLGEEVRAVQTLEIAIDAMDIPAVRPFWKAVFAYGEEGGRTGPKDDLVDPLRQGPSIWFQQMDEPRIQRNRIHFDVSVPHDEAERRIAAALAAGGVLVSDKEAPAFWILADPEGNEVCVCTWQARD